MHAWSQAVMDGCSTTDKPTRFQLENTGLWGETVRQRKPIVVNDFEAPNLLKKGYPEGNALLTRFMTIPVFIDAKIVAVVAVTNKKTEYTDLDETELTLMMDLLWNIIERWQMENELRLANKNLEQKVAERTSELLAINKELKRLVQVDGLTGTANRRYFDEYIEREWNRGMRQQKPLSVIMADIDFFKSYNDTYGHQKGDDYLKVIGAALIKTIKLYL